MFAGDGCPMVKEIVVRPAASAARPYRITVGAGVFARLPEEIAQIGRSGPVFICTDSTVLRLYGRRLQAALSRVGIASTLVSFPPGEQSKTSQVMEGLYSAMLSVGVTRGSLCIALGGGVVGDVAGFASSTMLRGIRLVQVPTTLLAQVDSSVGGKVGIDRAEGKNLVGSFYNPSAVFIDPGLLATLPPREYRNGLAEIVKIAAALDAAFFRRLERAAAHLTRRRRATLEEAIHAAVALKAAVVRRDERESGLRKSLNLGHTLGHALEAQSGYRLKHGEAVAAGLAGECAIAGRLGLLSPRDAERILSLLRSLGLPWRVGKIRDRERFWRALALDKKSDQAGLRFVLPASVGRCAIGVQVRPEVIASVCGLP